MEPIISLLRFELCRHGQAHPRRDVYEGWDSMIETMNTVVLENECPEYGTSTESLWSTIQDILISMWDKNCTPLHCLAHSLNPKFYSYEWLNGGPSNRVPPHIDGEISHGRKMAFRQLYPDRALLDEVEEGFAEFSTASGRFGGYDVVGDRALRNPMLGGQLMGQPTLFYNS